MHKNVKFYFVNIYIFRQANKDQIFRIPERHYFTGYVIKNV